MPFGVGKRWWRKASGMSNAQRQLSRKIGFPLSGRKSFKFTPGGKGCLVTLVCFFVGATASACLILFA